MALLPGESLHISQGSIAQDLNINYVRRPNARGSTVAQASKSSCGIKYRLEELSIRRYCTWFRFVAHWIISLLTNRAQELDLQEAWTSPIQPCHELFTLVRRQVLEQRNESPIISGDNSISTISLVYKVISLSFKDMQSSPIVEALTHLPEWPALYIMFVYRACQGHGLTAHDRYASCHSILVRLHVLCAIHFGLRLGHIRLTLGFTAWDWVWNWDWDFIHFCQMVLQFPAGPWIACFVCDDCLNLGSEFSFRLKMPKIQAVWTNGCCFNRIKMYVY